MASWFEEGYIMMYPPWWCQYFVRMDSVGERKGVIYLPTEAAVALDDESLVGTVLQRAADLDCGSHGTAVTAAVVHLAVLVAGRAGFGTREGSDGILGVVGVAVEPGRPY
jgi:hypothetical protein